VDDELPVSPEEHVMRDDVREALDSDRSSGIEHRTIDITTTGRRSGQPRRIEIWFYQFEGSIYLSGSPGPRTRDWLANLAAEPHFVFHLKHGDGHARRPGSAAPAVPGCEL
jgi:deazaflavin-dependent oxidoreductase (nitroreductase family)